LLRSGAWWRLFGEARLAKQIFVFAAVLALVAAPWYVRNLIIAGNPFYSLRFLRFAVNPIHDGIIQSYESALGVSGWTIGKWATLAGMIFLAAILQVLAGVPGGLRDFRKNGYLMVFALLGQYGFCR
jgi:hypothetical protein